MDSHQSSATTNAPLLPTVEVETGAQPKYAVIWLHGLGADGHDFEPVAEALGQGTLPPIRFVFPHAPARPVTVNNGYVMRAWYDIYSFDFMQRQEDIEGIRESTAQIEALIAHENARGIPDENIVVGGFSQGGVIALHVGLRHPRPLAGILALSTYLSSADKLAEEAHTANSEVSIFMAHGKNDGVIPYKIGHLSAELLRAQGLPVEWHDYPADHTVTMEELRDIENWLAGVLAIA